MVSSKLSPFFAKIREVGIPPKVTSQWLKGAGFTSSNDGALLNVIKLLKFVDDKSVPTDRWTRYRGATHKMVMAEAIREGYAALFEMYPDAQSRQQADLDSFFKTNSTKGSETIAKVVSTFKALVQLADFAHTGSAQVADKVESQDPKAHAGGGARDAQPKPIAPTVHIDVQVHIPPDASAEQLDAIFASMAKHFYRA